MVNYIAYDLVNPLTYFSHPVNTIILVNRI